MIQSIVCSTVGRIGGVIALSMEGLRSYWDPFPFVVMGCLGVISGFLGLFLPETTGEKLPDTLEESLTLGQNYKLAPCCSKKSNRITSAAPSSQQQNETSHVFA